VAIKPTSDGSAVVNTEHHWISIAEVPPPNGPKLLLIDRRLGVAVMASYTKQGTWTHWCALPRFKND